MNWSACVAHRAARSPQGPVRRAGVWGDCDSQGDVHRLLGEDVPRQAAAAAAATAVCSPASAQPSPVWLQSVWWVKAQSSFLADGLFHNKAFKIHRAASLLFRCPNWRQRSSPHHSAHRGSPRWKSQHHQPGLSPFLNRVGDAGQHGTRGHSYRCHFTSGHLWLPLHPTQKHSIHSYSRTTTTSPRAKKKKEKALFHFVSSFLPYSTVEERSSELKQLFCCF